MTSRAALPNRRSAETLDFDHAPDKGMQPMQYTATIGRHEDGRIGELFLNSSKIGSGSDANARDAAIAVSIGIQYGVPLDVLQRAMTRNGDGSPSSPIGLLLDLVAEASA
jgi:hypothetical protein